MAPTTTTIPEPMSPTREPVPMKQLDTHATATSAATESPRSILHPHHHEDTTTTTPKDNIVVVDETTSGGPAPPILMEPTDHQEEKIVFDLETSTPVLLTPPSEESAEELPMEEPHLGEVIEVEPPIPTNDEPVVKKMEGPSIVGMGTDAAENRALYDGWAKDYEAQIRDWGYLLPEVVANKLAKHMDSKTAVSSCYVLDAGCGDGLSGVALRDMAGIDDAQNHMYGCDLSPEMLAVAAERNCYKHLEALDLNETLLYPDKMFHVVTCVGTMTYLDPNSGVLEEFVRVCQKGGLILYSNRTDKMDMWKQVEQRLVDEGKLELVEISEPMEYLPNNPEYGETIQACIMVYRVLV